MTKTKTATVNVPSSSKLTKKQATEMTKEETIAHAIANTFNKAQKNTACHKKCAQYLNTIRQEDKDKFLEHFVKRMFPLLLVFKREPAVERVVHFIVQFATTDFSQESRDPDESFIAREATHEDSFAFDIISNLLPYANAKDKAIRFRVAQMVAAILNNLPDGVDIEWVVYIVIVYRSIAQI